MVVLQAMKKKSDTGVLTPTKAVGLLPPFRGGHYLTAKLSHDCGNFDCPISPKDSKISKYPQLWMTGLPGNPTYK